MQTGSANALPPKETPAAEHARNLHSQADELMSLNHRISEFINRMTGPQPESASTSDKEGEPNGVLYVAQFGSRRITLGLNRLQELVTLLENIA